MKKFLFVLLVVVILLVVVLVACPSGDPIEWETLKLGSMLPEIDSPRGKIYSNSTDYLSLEVNVDDQKAFNDYISNLKSLGFGIETNEYDSHFSAYNQDGYEVSASYYSSSEKMSISLNAPEKMSKLKWPDSGIATLLPIPPTNLGNIQSDSSNSFSVHLGNISLSVLKEYMDQCSNNGFNIDYSRSDENYSADNADGYHISIQYTGCNTASVYIKAPEETATEDITTPEELETEPPTDAPVEEKTEKPASSGIRPEFKEAMDSYEAFFDEYVDFMKKYQQNPSDLSLVTEYLDYMTRYADTMEKMGAWESESMSIEESAYYIEVTARINKKLLSVAA